MTSSTENVELKKEMGVLAKLRSFQFNLSQKILHAWIRPTILGTEQVAGAISPADEVCYVLNYQSTADLLVVDHAAQALDLPRPLDPLNAKEKDHFSFLVTQKESSAEKLSASSHNECCASWMT